MWLDPVALAWSSWLGLAIGMAGLMVSAIGLRLTFREAWKARTAAERVRDEVDRVVALMQSRSRLAALASSIPQIDLLLNSVEQDGPDTIYNALTPLRRSLIETVATSPDDRLA